MFLCVQGPLVARDPGGEIDLGPPRQQAVLAVLLFNAGRIVTAGSILRGVWGEDAPPSGTKLVPPYIYRLRQLLMDVGPAGRGPVIETLRAGYRLRLGGFRLDVDAFEEAFVRAGRAEAAGDVTTAAAIMRDANGTWYGEPLAGLPGPFALGRRSHLAERRLAGVERQLELDLSLGRFRCVIPALSGLRAEYPLRERLAILLMVALQRVGRRSEALDVFGQLRAALAGQLGIDPSDEVAETYRSILHSDRSPSLSVSPVFDDVAAPVEAR